MTTTRELLWSLVDDTCFKLRLPTLRSRVTVTLARRPDGLLLTVGQKGERELFHLTLHVNEGGVAFHVEGLGVDLTLLVVSLVEFERGLRRWGACFRDFLEDLVRYWRLRSRPRLLVLPFWDVRGSLPEPPARKARERKMAISQAQLQGIVQAGMGGVAIGEDYWEHAAEVAGAELKAAIAELGELAVVCDPRNRAEALVLAPDGTMVAWWGPRATQLFNANLARHWPTFYRDLEALTKPLVDAGVFYRLAYILAEVFFPSLLTLGQVWRQY